jgi:hypothetical protein
MCERDVDSAPHDVIPLEAPDLGVRRIGFRSHSGFQSQFRIDRGELSHVGSQAIKTPAVTRKTSLVAVSQLRPSLTLPRSRNRPQTSPETPEVGVGPFHPRFLIGPTKSLHPQSTIYPH